MFDNIERDVIAAMKLGYGVHYGAYKADYPNTKDAEINLDELDPDQIRICRGCGKRFGLTDRSSRKLYCSDECRAEHNSRLYCQRKKEQREGCPDELEV